MLRTAFTRKEVLRMAAALPFVGSALAACSVGTTPERSRGVARDYFRELGLRPFINGRGTITTLSSSRMEPEVLAAIEYASRHFVHLNDLNRAVGKRIAEMLQCEDAHVTAGAASALTLGTAAAITGLDNARIRAIPNIPGPQPEIVVQRGHRIYDQQFTACGARFVEVEGAAEMEAAINENTVLAFYFNAAPESSIPHEEFIAIARARGVPTFLDMAADVPPVENLFRYTRMGFDMVTVSGGKAMRGPQSSGLLFGRGDLIEAARRNHSPNSSIGRGMKVNKEEVIGMLVALELFLSKDHDAEWRKWEGWIEQIASSARSVPSVTTEAFVPPVANHVPHLRITWDRSVVALSGGDARRQLSEGEPPIEVAGGQDNLEMNVFMMEADEVAIVARRVQEVLSSAVTA